MAYNGPVYVEYCSEKNRKIYNKNTGGSIHGMWLGSSIWNDLIENWWRY